MSALAVVFPGQGSQKRGMGEDFVRDCPEAASVFEEASDALGFDVKSLCFADDSRLHLTEFTQPAILTTEIAMFRAMVARWGLEATHFGGHSLGEYSALVAAGTIPLAQAVCLVRFRGRLMQEVVPVGRGAMLAVMAKKLNPRFLRDVIGVLRVDLANWNSTNQIVLSGPAEDIETVHERMRRLMDEPDSGPGFLIKPLAVSAPFHSWMMAPMEWEFRKRVEQLVEGWDCSAASKVVSNFTGGFHEGTGEELVNALTNQISGQVRWVDNMRALAALKPKKVVEIGPRAPLRGFFRTLDVSVDAVTNLVSAGRCMQDRSTSSA